VKFVVDAQLPPALARLFRETGCDAFAVREIGLREANSQRKSARTAFSNLA
jgi:predicted nuclease of predicted toxin-antitoxin system